MTFKQISANQRNAKLSTGPKSPETKAKTRLNAKRDGFTGQVTTLSDEERPIFEKFQADFIKDLAPETVMETSLATAIAWDTWRLNRIRAVETNMFALETFDNSRSAPSDDPETDSAMSDIITFVNQSKRFTLMTLYQQRMERSIHKNLATLRQLQTERKQARRHDLQEEMTFALANDINDLPYEAPAAPSENGYVFSNREIFTAAHRVTALQDARLTLSCATKRRIHFPEYAPNAKAAGAGASSAAENLQIVPEMKAA